MDPAPLPDKGITWKNYEIHAKLYKDYLDLVLKFNIFFYAVTGAVLSYCFSKPEVPLMRYAILFPAVMSLAFGAFFVYGAKLANVSREEFKRVAEEFCIIVPEYQVVQLMLCISGGLLLVIGIVLVVVVIFFPFTIPIPPIVFTGF